MQKHILQMHSLIRQGLLKGPMQMHYCTEIATNRITKLADFDNNNQNTYFKF